ncbi:MAG: pentapeptide repeat-containing protein [Caldilineaceae bacterium]
MRQSAGADLRGAVLDEANLRAAQLDRADWKALPGWG